MSGEKKVEIIEGPIVEETLRETIFYINEFAALEREDGGSTVYDIRDKSHEIGNEIYEILRSLDSHGRGKRLEELFSRCRNLSSNEGHVRDVGYGSSKITGLDSGIWVERYEISWDKFYRMGMPVEIRVRTRVINEIEPSIPNCNQNLASPDKDQI